MSRHVTCPKCDTEFLVKRMPADMKVPCPGCDVRIKLAPIQDEYDDEDDYEEPAPRPRKRRSRSRRSSSSDTNKVIFGLLAVAGSVLLIVVAVQAIKTVQSQQDNRPRVSDNGPPTAPQASSRDRGDRSAGPTTPKWTEHRFAKFGAEIEFPKDNIQTREKSERSESAQVSDFLGAHYHVSVQRLPPVGFRLSQSQLQTTLDGIVDVLVEKAPNVRTVGSRKYSLQGNVIFVEFEVSEMMHGNDRHRWTRLAIVPKSGLSAIMTVETVDSPNRPVFTDRFFTSLRLPEM